jgi:hypothetical protein
VVLETEGIAGTPDVAALTVAADGSAEHPKSPGVGLEKETYRGQEEEEVNSQRGTRGQQTKDNPRDRAPEGQGSRRSGDWNLDGLSPRNDREERLLQQLDLELSHLTPLEQTQFKDCLISFADVFALNSTELGTTSVREAAQHRVGRPPAYQRPPWRVPFGLREMVEELVENMLSQGVIVLSSSPWASPIVLVCKKDGGTRFCVDYRRLNHITKMDKFPLPRIDETLDLLTGA